MPRRKKRNDAVTKAEPKTAPKSATTAEKRESMSKFLDRVYRDADGRFFFTPDLQEPYELLGHWYGPGDEVRLDTVNETQLQNLLGNGLLIPTPYYRQHWPEHWNQKHPNDKAGTAPVPDLGDDEDRATLTP